MTIALMAGTAVLAVVVAYGAACTIAPFRTCRRCGGVGQRKNWLGQMKPCWYCGGKGQRLRLGRRVFNHLSRLRREGTRIDRRTTKGIGS